MSLTRLQEPSHSPHTHQITTLHTLNILQFCQLHLNKPEKKETEFCKLCKKKKKSLYMHIFGTHQLCGHAYL